MSVLSSHNSSAEARYHSAKLIYIAEQPIGFRSSDISTSSRDFNLGIQFSEGSFGDIKKISEVSGRRARASFSDIGWH
jgi:hypothetical protein